MNPCCKIEIELNFKPNQSYIMLQLKFSRTKNLHPMFNKEQTMSIEFYEDIFDDIEIIELMQLDPEKSSFLPKLLSQSPTAVQLINRRQIW